MSLHNYILTSVLSL